MKPRVIASALLCSATLLSVAVPAAVNASTTTPSITQTARQVSLPKAFSDLQLSNGKLTDQAQQFKTINTIGTPTIATATGLKGDQKVIKLDGKSAYSLPVDKDQYTKLSDGMAIEAFFRYDPKASTSGEHDILSNQNSGGFGLGTVNGQVTFFAHVDGGYRQPHAALQPGKWVHAVGVIDKAGKAVKLYLNGSLVSTIPVPAGKLKLATGTNINHFVLGGDSADNFKAESFMTGEIKTARVYDHALSSDEIKALNDNAQVNVAPTPIVEQSMEARLLGASDVVAGHIYEFNVHSRQLESGDINHATYEIHYDPERFDYVGATQSHSGTIALPAGPGVIRVRSMGPMSGNDFKNYGQTRLAKIQLRAKPVASGTTSKTKISFGKTEFSINNTPVQSPKLKIDGDQNITIHGSKSADYNGDGIVGAGDIALAPADKKAAVAQEAVIHPYKHVIVLTTDGGGNPWDPKGMYYAPDNDHHPVWKTDAETLAKRENTYTMDLFNKQFAMSTTAHAVVPSISAQNYTSMLHGVTWGAMDKDYQVTNSIAGNSYFSDLDKATPKYPSVFKALQADNPNQSKMVFSEWGPLINGIVEPDAAVTSKYSVLKHSFKDVADYIGQAEFDNTALTYVQTDYMDHTGHGTGFYNDKYWHEYAAYDGLFKGIMDKLVATGHIHDTLVIANADHGGVSRDHGQDTTESNTNIFMALGGETIDNGRRLKGGSNADISPLVLHALQAEQPASMTGKVFDKSAFLDQTELSKKHRDVEAITLTQKGNHADLKLGNLKHLVRTADMRINLAGRTLTDVKLPANSGTKILRQSVKNGVLTLTLSFDEQPSSKNGFVTLNFKNGNKPATIDQAMIGTQTGQEILVDLFNETNNDHSTDNNGNGSGNHGNSNNGNQSGTQNGGNNNATNKPDQKPSQPDNNQTPTPAPEKPNHGHQVKPTPSKKAKHLYATGKLGFYKSTHFTKSTLHRWFKAAKQNLWPRFSLLNRVHTKDGYRYKVKDLNRKSKTFNKVGYITTNKRLVTATEYTGKVTRVKVIAPKGLNSFRDKGLSKKASHYNAKAKLSVKRIVKDGQHVRLQLSNGTYVTADKHQVQVMH